MEAQNILEFDKFKESITYMQVLGNGNILFPATIAYTYNGQTVVEKLNVKLTATKFNYGSINIDEGDVINSEDMHLKISPKFQSYVFKDGALFIDNKSKSKIGFYKITITPIVFTK
jgi:hypothetical protein